MSVWQSASASTGLTSSPGKPNVRVATTANGTLATAFANGQTVDGVVLATNDRILIKNQTSGDENGTYIVQPSGAPVRSVDLDENSEADEGGMWFVEEGTANNGKLWALSNSGAIVVGTTALTFLDLTAGGGAATFVALSDTPGSFTTAGGIYGVNVSGTAVAELELIYAEPAANHRCDCQSLYGGTGCRLQDFLPTQ